MKEQKITVRGLMKIADLCDNLKAECLAARAAAKVAKEGAKVAAKAAKEEAKAAAKAAEKTTKPRAPRRPWTTEQDDCLRNAVLSMGAKKWKEIAAKVPGRDHIQCVQRWKKARGGRLQLSVASAAGTPCCGAPAFSQPSLRLTLPLHGSSDHLLFAFSGFEALASVLPHSPSFGQALLMPRASLSEAHTASL